MGDLKKKALDKAEMARKELLVPHDGTGEVFADDITEDYMKHAEEVLSEPAYEYALANGELPPEAALVELEEVFTPRRPHRRTKPTK